METITSRQNALVRTFRAVVRRRGGRVLLEGAHLAEGALEAGVPVEVAALSVRLLDRRGGARAAEARALAGRLEQAGARVVSVSDPVMAAISPAETPSGLVAIAAYDAPPIEAALTPPPSRPGATPLVLLIADVQDPGNVGAMVRSAEAAGATGAVVCGASADPFGWKALRGAMGSSLRLPVAARPATRAAVDAARGRGLQVVATDTLARRSLYAADLTKPMAVLVGSEGAGLPRDVLERADEVVAIPMRPPVESLNVAVSAALVLYEAQRQRKTLESSI